VTKESQYFTGNSSKGPLVYISPLRNSRSPERSGKQSSRESMFAKRRPSGIAREVDGEQRQHAEQLTAKKTINKKVRPN